MVDIDIVMLMSLMFKLAYAIAIYDSDSYTGVSIGYWSPTFGKLDFFANNM